MTSITLVNGHIISSEAPAISPLDRGLTLGDGLFETIKVEDGRPWYLERHLARLESAARRMELRYPHQIREWITTVLETPTVTTHRSLALRVTLTRGIQTHGLVGLDDVDSTTVITLAPVPTIPTAVYETGISLHIAPAPRNERAYTAGLKTTSYAEPVLALRHARNAGYDDVLFLDTKGFVSEASASNVFAWIGEHLVTPPLNCGVLPGITRAVILEMVRHTGLSVREQAMTLAEFKVADEIFCTSSLREIAPVVRIEKEIIGAGIPGAQTLRLMRSYAAQSQRI